MKVIFFNKNLEFSKKFLNENPNSIAFWYTKGLTSYLSVDKLIDIEELLLEEDIFDDFKKEFPHLVNNADYDIFPKGQDKVVETKGKICFFASNDTHVYLFKNILKKYGPDHFDLYCRTGESAKEAAEKLNIPVKGHSSSCKKNAKDYDLLVLGNDWGLLERDLSNQFISLGKNTICLQESILDLNPKDNRLGHCSFPVFQGLNSLESKNLNGLICAVIGNPRFEDFRMSEPIEENRIFVNVNFTYGIFEDKRKTWVNDILEVSSEMNVPYIISQHPRDNGNLEDLNVIKSHAGIVHETIIKSSVVISRFSSLLLESILLGRPAIYYNPHGEKMDYHFEPDNNTLFYATDKESLKLILEEILSPSYRFIEKNDSLVQFHLGVTHKGNASGVIFKLLKSSLFFKSIKRGNQIENLIVTTKLAKLKISSSKSFLKIFRL